jgi:hypothetical protein
MAASPAPQVSQSRSRKIEASDKTAVKNYNNLFLHGPDLNLLSGETFPKGWST